MTRVFLVEGRTQDQSGRILRASLSAYQRVLTEDGRSGEFSMPLYSNRFVRVNSRGKFIKEEEMSG